MIKSKNNFYRIIENDLLTSYLCAMDVSDLKHVPYLYSALMAYFKALGFPKSYI